MHAYAHSTAGSGTSCIMWQELCDQLDTQSFLQVISIISRVAVISYRLLHASWGFGLGVVFLGGNARNGWWVEVGRDGMHGAACVGDAWGRMEITHLAKGALGAQLCIFLRRLVVSRAGEWEGGGCECRQK